MVVTHLDCERKRRSSKIHLTVRAYLPVVLREIAFLGSDFLEPFQTIGFEQIQQNSKDNW